MNLLEVGGLEKLRGENWFAGIRDAFPFPFSSDVGKVFPVKRRPELVSR